MTHFISIGAGGFGSSFAHGGPAQHSSSPPLRPTSFSPAAMMRGSGQILSRNALAIAPGIPARQAINPVIAPTLATGAVLMAPGTLAALQRRPTSPVPPSAPPSPLPSVIPPPLVTTVPSQPAPPIPGTNIPVPGGGGGGGGYSGGDSGGMSADTGQDQDYDPNAYDPSQYGWYDPSMYAPYNPDQYAPYDPSQFAPYNPDQYGWYDPSQLPTYDPSMYAPTDPNQYTAASPYDLNDPYAQYGYATQYADQPVLMDDGWGMGALPRNTLRHSRMSAKPGHSLADQFLMLNAAHPGWQKWGR